MVDDRPFFIALSAVPGIGPARFKLLLTHFKKAENVWRADEKTLQQILTPALFQRFIKFRKSFDISSYLDRLIKKNISVLTQYDKNYPKLLKEIPDPPPVLYIRGKLPVSKKTIGVVGTRKMTSYGREVTEVLVRDLVRSGFTIVSGLARGVDSHAHRVTLGNSGKTIAVLGGGVDRVYPVENQSLAGQIESENGAVISEFPIGMVSVPGNFPARNRIISGLSLGILVTEAGEESGSLITASLAAEQGREVFAVPGPIYSKMTAGPAKLIKEGAKLVTSVGDILDELKFDSGFKETNIEDVVASSRGEQEILDLLEAGPVHIDLLSRKTKKTASEIGSILSMMELSGKINSLGGGNYSSARHKR